jgi:hypothetical protein
MVPPTMYTSPMKDTVSFPSVVDVNASGGIQLLTNTQGNRLEG